MGHRRCLFVFDVVGDRRDEDLQEICRLIASICQHAIVYEDKQLRGRQPGELMDLVEKAFLDCGVDAGAVEKIADETEAIERALSMACCNDLVCIMSGRIEQVIDHLRAFENRSAQTFSNAPLETKSGVVNGLT
jgi:cyanophycin synthetase